MPAAAVIPAPIAYIKVVAVKKLVVMPSVRLHGVCSSALPSFCQRFSGFISWLRAQIFYLEKIRVFQAGLRRNTLAWNNRIGLQSLCWFPSME